MTDDHIEVDRLACAVGEDDFGVRQGHLPLDVEDELVAPALDVESDCDILSPIGEIDDRLPGNQIEPEISLTGSGSHFT